MAKKEKLECSVCDNGKAVIKTLTLVDIENLQKEIEKFKYNEVATCKDESIEVLIYANGDVILQGDFNYSDYRKVNL